MCCLPSTPAIRSARGVTTTSFHRSRRPRHEDRVVWADEYHDRRQSHLFRRHTLWNPHASSDAAGGMLRRVVRPPTRHHGHALQQTERHLRMQKQQTSKLARPAGSEERIPLRDRLLWMCPMIGLVAGTMLLWLFGLTLWTAIGLVLLIVCPLIVLWALTSVRRGQVTRKKAPH